MTNRTFMTVEEVAAELGVSKSYAYKIVKEKSGMRSRKCVGNPENDGCFAGGKGGPETGLP